MPRLENNDVKNSIIRTTIKNENLLAQKMEKDKVRKNNSKKLNNSLRAKTDRSAKVEGVLATKIQQSIDRARFVQGMRKAGWDHINKTINVAMEKEGKEQNDKNAAEQGEKDAKEEYIRYFRSGLDASEAEKTGAPEFAKQESGKPPNMFSLLEETEC